MLELGTLIAGPFAGRLLGDMGADVIKVEPPGAPDPLRTWGQAELDGHHVFWTVHARNKRAITLDLRRPRGRELFLELVEKSDIVVENFRPGTLEKWDLGYDVLSERNPGIILVRVSGYGQTGPDAHKAGYASVAEAASGLRHLNGFPGGPPPRLALSLGDSLAGMFGAQGALAALYRRSVTGHGQVVDVALTESCLAVQESTIPDYDVGGVVRGPSGTRLEGIAPSNIYRSADGSWVVIAANQDTVFARLCTAMGRPELATDDRFATHGARGRNQDELDKIIGAWAAERQPGEIIETLSAAGVIAGPINTVAEVVDDPQLRARGMLVEHYDERIERNVLGPGVVPVLSESPGGVRNAGPARPGPTQRRRLRRAAGQDRRGARGVARRGGAVNQHARVDIREVSLRDGLQIEKPIPLSAKLELLAAVAATGVREVEATAFVSPVEGAVDGRCRRTRRAAAQLPRHRVLRSGRQPQRRQAGRRRRTAVDRVRGGGRRHVQQGQRRAHQRRGHRPDRRDRRHRARQRRHRRGRSSPPRGTPHSRAPPRPSGYSTSPPPPAIGAWTGSRSPTPSAPPPRGRVSSLIAQLRPVIGDMPLGAHFHNTRGAGLASAYAAVSSGVTRLDASVGGLGGCPFAPGATGNIATEDLVYLLTRQRYRCRRRPAGRHRRRRSREIGCRP